MASAKSKPDSNDPVIQDTIIQMADVGVRVARRKVALGLPEMPRNSGERRTQSKRGLLKAIEDAGGDW